MGEDSRRERIRGDFVGDAADVVKEKQHPEPLTRETIRQVLIELFEEWPYVDAQTHTAHHEWVRVRIERDRAIRDLCWGVAKVAAQWSVLGLLGAGLVWVRSHWDWPWPGV